MAEKTLLKRASGGIAEFSATDTIPDANMPAVSVISPSQITSDQDDYSPTGWADADVVRLNFDSSGRAITGFAAWTNTRQKRIVNTSANFGYLPCEHPDSSAANRVTGTCDHIIAPYGTLVLEYDDTSDRVRVVANSFNPAAPGFMFKGAFYQVSPGATSGTDWGSVGFGIASGDNGVVDGTSTLPGSWFLTTLASASSASSLYFAKTLTNTFNSELCHVITSAYVFFPVLSDGTDTYTFSFGLASGSSSTTPTLSNEISIKYSHGLNSGKFQGVCRSSSSESTADLGVTVSADTAYILTVCCSKGATEARFYIDGVFAGRITSNVPTSNIGTRAIISKSAGTTPRLAHIASMLAVNVI